MRRSIKATMRRSIKAATDIVSATASVAEGWLEELYPQYPLETIPESSIPPGHAVVGETGKWPIVQLQKPKVDASSGRTPHLGAKLAIPNSQG